MEDNYADDGDFIGGVSPRITQLSSLKGDFFRDRNYGGFIIFQSERTSSPIVSSLSKEYSVGVLCGSTIGVGYGDGKGGMGLSTTKLTY